MFFTDVNAENVSEVPQPLTSLVATGEEVAPIAKESQAVLPTSQEAYVATPLHLNLKEQIASKLPSLQSLPFKLALAGLVLVTAVSVVAYVVYTMYQESLVNEQRLIEEAEAKAAGEALEVLERDPQKTRKLRNDTAVGSLVIAAFTFIAFFGILGIALFIILLPDTLEKPYSLIPNYEIGKINFRFLVLFLITAFGLVGVGYSPRLYPPLASVGISGGLSLFITYVALVHRGDLFVLSIDVAWFEAVVWNFVIITALLHAVPIGLMYLMALF